MSVPIVPILSLASGAVNLLNTVISKSATEGFDSLLSNLTGETDGVGAALLKGLTAKLKTEESDSSDALAVTGAGMVVLQLMAALKDAGLNAADISALMTGEGVTLSDDSLKKLLTTFGLNNDQISTILSDADLTNELKTQITQGIQAMIGMKAADKGGDEAQSAQTTATNQATESQNSSADETVQALVNTQTNRSLSDQSKLAAAVQDLVKAATQNDDTLTAVLNEIATLDTTTEAGDSQSSLNGLVQTALKHAEMKLQTKAQGATSTNMGGTTAATVEEAVDTLEGTLGIQKDVLEKLFFATDTKQRQAALDEVKNDISTYLKQQGDKPVGEDVKEALSLVRSATTKKEWSGIESAIKSVRSDLQVPAATVAFDQGAFKALAQKITGGDGSPLFEHFTQDTIDQIKIQLPSQVKDGEGVATLKLNPPLLGRLEISLTMEDGQLQATFKTENQCAKDMLQTHIATLKETLADQGIKVTQLTITSSLDNRDNRQQDAWAQWQHGRGQGDAQGGGSGHAGRKYREDGANDYGETHNGNRLATSGSLDLFA